MQGFCLHFCSFPQKQKVFSHFLPPGCARRSSNKGSRLTACHSRRPVLLGFSTSRLCYVPLSSYSLGSLYSSRETGILPPSSPAISVGILLSHHGAETDIPPQVLAFLLFHGLDTSSSDDPSLFDQRTPTCITAALNLERSLTNCPRPVRSVDSWTSCSKG